jgi:Flp pilus assembly protein TadG
MTKSGHAKSTAQSLVEFALVGPLFLFLVLGVLEGARLIYAYNTINHASQEAARLGILADTPGTSAVQSKAVSAAEPLTVNAADVSVEVNDGAKTYGDRQIGDRLEVTVDYSFTPVVLLVFDSGAAISLSAASELMIE